MELDVTKSIEEQLEGPRTEPKKLTVREQREKERKNKAFTVKWRQLNYDATMKAFYDEVARLAGRMERWKRDELVSRGEQAMYEYKELYVENAPFDLVDEAVRLKAHIPRMRYRALQDIPNDINQERYGQGAKNDPKKIAKLEAEAERLVKEKMPAAAFRIYEIWCEIAYVMISDAHENQYVKLSDYEVYDYNYEEDL